MSVNRTLVAENELLSDLDPVDRDALVAVAIGKTYAAGDVIFKENEDAYAVCLLLEGRIGLQMDVGNGRNLMVSTVDAGEVFAWSGLVRPHQFTATARAIEDCEVAIFKSEDLTRLFQENPRFGYAVMLRVASLIGERLRDTHLQLLGMFGA
ncbi:MAG TPA: cyclic nucleotide-binding domain-containing protein [Thermoleophilia bacterium]|nr:cyclic nucleotide-binding domain-containing protein [Thermoleophilia bacterium]